MIRQMRRVAVRLVSTVGGDRQLPLYLLGAIGAAFVFAFVLRAEAGVVFGVLVSGCVAGIYEWNLRRKK
jgi:hypothetical protein